MYQIVKKNKRQLDREYFDLFFGSARWEKYKEEKEEDESQQRQHKTKTNGSSQREV